MGPFRRRLTQPAARLALLAPAVLLLGAGPALAEVCDKERPNWSPDQGPANGLTETYHVFTTAPGLVLLALLAAALYFKRPSLWTPVALVAGLLAMLTWAGAKLDPTGFHQMARAEGCVAQPTLPIAILAAISVIAIIQSLRPARRTEEI
ncbi:MAG: hypothetical protein ACRBBT_04140 [Paracoccaceae bacterium]